MASLQKICPNFWFDNQAEEAAVFYTSIFRDSEIKRVIRYGKAGFAIHGQEAGTVMSVEFVLENQVFFALNAGPKFKFNESISFIVNCANQDEIDYYWEMLSYDGNPEAQECGWLKDKFGVSWQIVPTIFHDMLANPDSVKTQRMMNELYKMKKINVAELKNAFEYGV